MQWYKEQMFLGFIVGMLVMSIFAFILSYKVYVATKAMPNLSFYEVIVMSR